MGYLFRTAVKVIVALYGIPALLAVVGVFPIGVAIGAALIATMLVVVAYILERAYLKRKDRDDTAEISI
jgi:hypothetical protein